MPTPGPRPEGDALGPILALLGGEICRPLDLLRSGIGRMLDDPARPLGDAERTQARTMLGLCDELGRLTRDCMGE